MRRVWGWAFFSILMIFMPVFSGCGISYKVHEAALNDLVSLNQETDSVREELFRTTSQRDSLATQLKALEVRIQALQSRLLTYESDLESLRQQNLDLVNIRDNQAAEIAVLEAQAGDLKAAKAREVQRLKQTYDNLVGELEGEIEKGKIKVTQVLDRLSVSLMEQILFDSGSAEIKPEGREVLKRLGEILKKVSNKQIRIEGHTDNVPIGPELAHSFSSNWDLSAIRAINVVRFLSENAGVDPLFLSATGYSSYRPTADNDTIEGRSSNRRIEIKLLPRNLDQIIKELR